MSKKARSEFNITLANSDETQADVPVSFTVEYPANHGIYVIQAINELSNMTEDLCIKFVNAGDQSVIDKLDEVGLGIMRADD